MYKVTRKLNFYTAGTETVVWTGYTEQDGMDYISAQISEDMVNGMDYSYKLYVKNNWTEIPLNIYPSFVKVERA